MMQDVYIYIYKPVAFHLTLNILIVLLSLPVSVFVLK